MHSWEVVVAIGHMGQGKSREEKRYCQARTSVDARCLAWSWGAVKNVLEVRPCVDEKYIAARERGLIILAPERILEKIS
ncbi:MAG: hypothetical protein WA118_07355 [Carboxydocellales bacterium]